MAETVVILFATLLLLLGTIQFGLIYNAKITLNYATFEAARAGALNYADHQAIQYGLARGLAPLYTSVETNTPMLGSGGTIGRVQLARKKVFAEAKDGEFVCIERINPNSEAFSAYGEPDLVSDFPQNGEMIPNDKLLYRSAIAGGGGVSIQDANLLKIRVTYCYPMYIPFIATTIKKLYKFKGGYLETAGGFQENCLEKDRMPIVAQAVIRMQTPAWDDPSFPNSCD